MEHHMKYDVVIVGAGPAGSTAAKKIAEHNIKVLLIDKKPFPREKPCGGGLPTRVIQQFPYIKPFIESYTYRSKTYSSTFKYCLDFQRDQPIIATTRRKTFDHNLVKIAEQQGAHILLGKTVTDIKQTKTKTTLILDDGQQIETNLIIGCDGMRSIVAEKTQLKPQQCKKCICILQETTLKPKIMDQYFTKERTVFIFVKIQGIAGYGWIFRKKNSINVGIGEFEPAIKFDKQRKSLREVYEDFISELKDKEILPPDFSTKNAKGATLPIFPLEKTYSDNVLLCGDAAGFINPITGEGIYYAMKSADLAADTAILAIQTKQFNEQVLSQYQKAWMKLFGKDLKHLGPFNRQWGKSTEKFVRLLIHNKTLAKLAVGVTGGQLSFARYRYLIIFLYMIALLKDKIIKK